MAWCLVEGSLGSSRFNDPKRCSNARVTLQNVILCTKKVSQTPRSFHSPARGREDDSHTGLLVPPCRAPFGSRPAGMLPTSLPEEVMSGSKAGQPMGSHKTRTCCSCEPEPQHRHWELWSFCHPYGTSRAACACPDHRAGGKKWSISLRSV